MTSVMNPGMNNDEPTPEFRAHLEWQIQSALRRETRFSEPTPRPAARFRTALVAAVALAIGAAGGMVPGYAQENRAREELLDVARGEETLLKLRMELVRADFEQARRRFEAGVAERQILTYAEDQLRALEAAMGRNRLDMEEIGATSAAPRNDLQAPLVGQRDFVRERLMLDLTTAQRALAAAEQEAIRAKQRYDVGVAQAVERLQAEADVAAARARMSQLAATLELRRRALKGDLKADEIGTEMRRLELTQQLQTIRQTSELAQARLEEARRRFAVGISPEIDVKQAELAILQEQLELKRIQQQLQALGVKKD